MTSADKYKTIDAEGMRLAIAEARAGYHQGGIPIGSVLLLPNHESDSDGNFTILGSGHNERIQKSSPTLHGEISALENAGRLPPQVYRKSTIVVKGVMPSYLRLTFGTAKYSPCSMCSGAILLYKIPRVVIGENETFVGEEELLRSQGVEVVVMENKDCKDLMRQFISKNPQAWNEDIGELDFNRSE